MKTGNTAVRRNKPSRPLKMLLDELYELRQLSHGNPLSLDWYDISWFDLGCGRGDDIEYLEKYLRLDTSKSSIDGYDPNHKPEPNPLTLPSGSVDIVTCFYVLNVLPTVRQRRTVLRDAYYIVQSDGLTAVAARAKDNVNRAIRDGWREHKDGWITGSGTFQRGFTVGELSSMMFDVGWEMVISIADNRDYCMVVGIEDWQEE